MKIHLPTIFLLLITLASCSTVRKTVKTSEPTKEVIKKVQLNETDKRKFDYFFYEASREKMKGNLQKSAMYLSECLKIDATSSAAMYELANILVSGNELTKAQELLERAIKIEQENIWYKLMLAQLYQQNKLGVKAVALYEEIVKDEPDNEEYLYGLAQVYQKNGMSDKALDAYDKLEESIGLNEIIILEKEKILLKIGKNKTALQELTKLLNKFPNEARYYGFIADYYLYLKDNNKAREFYNMVIQKDPDNGMGYFSLGNLDLVQKDTVSFIANYKKGLSLKSLPFEVKFQRILPFLMDTKHIKGNKNFLTSFFDKIIETHPYEASAYVYQANYFKALKENDKAIAAFRNALSIEDKNELIWQDYLLLLIDKQDFKQMYGNAKVAISHFPNNSFFYLLAGSSANQLGDNDEALLLLDAGLRKVGENQALKAQFYANIGDVAYAEKQYDKAFKSYEESLKIDELNIVVLNNYSYYLTLQEKDLEKAEHMSSKCIEMEPGNSTYLDTYAWVLFKRQRYFEAKYIIERAIDNGGDSSAVVIEHYGDILFKNGDVEGALNQWKKSKEMGNKSETLKVKIETKSYKE